jgi:hypothetical protein
MVYLKLHEEVFANIIREDLHRSSVKKWEQYLQSFYYVESPKVNYKYNPCPLIDVQIVVTLPEKKKRKEDKEK